MANSNNRHVMAVSDFAGDDFGRSKKPKVRKTQSQSAEIRFRGVIIGS
jgi:hypothetical protein